MKMESEHTTSSNAIVERHRDGFVISTDPARLDLHAIHEFLAADSYWAKQIPFETFARSAKNSLCFGVYDSAGAQVGFARVVSDFATFAYIADVFVLDSQRGHGLGKFLMECIMQHPQLQGLRRWVLTTRDAHGLYEQYGFTSPKCPERYMEILRPNMYAEMQQKESQEKDLQEKELQEKE
jgi:GNAT superfamily N-acetyltransferase